MIYQREARRQQYKRDLHDWLDNYYAVMTPNCINELLEALATASEAGKLYYMDSAAFGRQIADKWYSHLRWMETTAISSDPNNPAIQEGEP